MRHNEKLLVSFRTGNWAFDDPLYFPPFNAGEPVSNVVASFSVTRRVAHDAALADRVAAQLKLRFDQRHQGANRCSER